MKRRFLRQDTQFNLVKKIADPKLRRWGVLIQIIIIVACSHLYAQESPSVFSEITQEENMNDITDEVVRSRYVRLAVDLFREFTFASEFEDELKELRLNFFDDTELVAVNDSIEPNDLGGFTWNGRVKGEKESVVTLVVRDGVIAGNILTGNTRYQIRYAGNGDHLVEEVDTAYSLPECGTTPVALEALTISDVSDDKLVTLTATDLTLVEVDNNGGLVPLNNSSDCTIDLLVFYTTKAKENAGGFDAIVSEIQLGVQNANNAYANSQTSARLHLLATLEIGYNETGNFDTDLERLTGKSDGYMDNIHNFRDDYGADLVTLIVGNKSGYGNECGRANRMCNVSLAYAEYGFNVAKEDCLTAYTLAHEVSHNLGCNHAPSDPLGKPCISYNHSYGYKNMFEGFRTIMAYEPGSIIPYFSNPNASYNGSPTGTATQNNALTIDKTCSTVAQFRSEKNCVTKTAMSDVSGTSMEAKTQDEKRVTLSTLYRFRDDLLNRTANGRDYITLFYKHTLEASWLLVKDQTTRKMTRDTLIRLAPVIDRAVRGEPAVLSTKDFSAVEGILACFAAKGSREMQQSIKKVVEDIHKPKVLRSFGLTIEEHGNIKRQPNRSIHKRTERGREFKMNNLHAPRRF